MRRQRPAHSADIRHRGARKVDVLRAATGHFQAIADRIVRIAHRARTVRRSNRSHRADLFGALVATLY
jgi:hypothetical protein